MKYIITLITVLLAAFGAFAQDNDTALLKKNRVAEVHKKIYIPYHQAYESDFF